MLCSRCGPRVSLRSSEGTFAVSEEEPMRSTSIACFSGGALATLAMTGALAQAPEPSVSIPVASVEIVRILKGKICTTEGGAKFTFTSDGHYAYAGLGRTHSGHYWLG